MKTKIILIVSVIASIAGGFWAGHMQAATSWKHRLYDDFYTRSGADATVYAEALADFREGNTNAAFAMLEQHLDLSLARIESLPAGQNNSLLAGCILKARDYRLAHPWHGSPPRLEAAAARALASAK